MALGKANIGDPSKVAHLDKELLEVVYEEIKEQVEEGIDRMKTSADPVPVIIVGGGSILIPTELEGASTVIRPNNNGVANAIGSAISQVSGQVEQMFSLDELGRDETLEKAKEMAVDEAVSAGADRDSCEIVDVEDVPLAYLPGNATKVRVKAAGALARN